MAHPSVAGVSGVRSSVAVRMVRATRLEVALYREVRDDRAAMAQALAVVLLVALAHAFGGVLRAVALGWDAVEGFVFGFVGEWTFWIVGSLVMHTLGTRLLGGAGTYREFVRCYGFAVAPGVLVFVAASVSAFDIPAAPFLAVTAMWRLAAGFVAVRQSLRLNVAKSIVTLISGTVIGGVALGVTTRILVTLTGWE